MICNLFNKYIPLLLIKNKKLFFLVFIYFNFFLYASVNAEYILKRGNGTEPDSLDPHKATGTWENNIIGDIFLGLVTESAIGNIIPGSARDWKISDDGREYTFYIREEMLWSDGMPVTANDFAFALKRIINPATASQYASLLFTIKNAQEINKGELNIDDLGVEALDAKTLKISLRRPVPFFIQLLSHYTTYPLPEHVLNKYGDGWVKSVNIVSNGAYVLKEWSSNSHILIQKNKLFYDSKNIFFDKVYFYPIEDNRLALRMFRSGDIDMNITSAAFPAAELDKLLKSIPEEARIYPYLGNSYLPFNTKNPPFNDIRVREALSLLIDREIINTKVVKARNKPAYSFVPPQTRNFSSGANLSFINLSKEERKRKARKLLSNAGYGKDNPLRFEMIFRNSYDNARRISAIAAMLKEENIELKMLPYEARITYNQMSNGSFQLGDAGWVADYNDPYNFLYLFLCDAGPMNYSGFCNKKFDSLLDEASMTLNIEKRSNIMREAEQLMLNDHPIIPISFATHRVLVSKKIGGYLDNVSNIHRSRYFYLK
jgi:oligopeptide transport system substrate-binding protein